MRWRMRTIAHNAWASTRPGARGTGYKTNGIVFRSVFSSTVVSYLSRTARTKLYCANRLQKSATASSNGAMLLQKLNVIAFAAAALCFALGEISPPAGASLNLVRKMQIKFAGIIIIDYNVLIFSLATFVLQVLLLCSYLVQREWRLDP